MSDDYLWDGSGPPDPETVRLEKKLKRFRFEGSKVSLTPSPRRSGSWKWVAGVAALFLFALALGWNHWFPETRYYTTAELAPGERVRSGSGERAQIEIGDIGVLDLDPDTSVRILDVAVNEDFRDARYGVYLEHGSLTATIFAPPRIFQMGTPSGIAVDLGCVYTASVKPEGETLVQVQAGWVAFETPLRKVFVPAGARVLARPGQLPGTPVWEDAEEEFLRALDELDRNPEHFQRPLETILRTLEPRDSLTLWHLLQYPIPPLRESVYPALAKLDPPPAGVRPGMILAGEEEALLLWKEGLATNW